MAESAPRRSSRGNARRAAARRAGLGLAGINGVTKSGLAAAAAALSDEPEELLSATGQSVQILPAEDPSSWPRGVALDEHRPIRIDPLGT